jgi:DNA-binding CsgD family transcriptional regulator/tetratricopeptide (TPR) repeat protein
LVEPLLEREAVLAELAALARRAARGAGQLVLLRGEAGIGKTAVINQFTAALEPGVQVLHGWCDPLAAPRPLGPLHDALAGVGRAAAGALDAAIESGDTSTLYRRLLTVLRDGHCWAWVIEDVHWADGATLDLLRFLSRRISSLPLLLVVSYRDEELDRQHPLSVALGDIATCAGVSRTELEPLSRAAVAVLASGSGVNADQLYQLTGGNPFYATEVLAAGPEVLSQNALPRSVSEAVRGRLARLSAAAHETAHAAAVCGPRASPALVEKVCANAAVGLPECLAAGVLVTDGDTVGFRHELARRATLDQLPSYQRAALHKRVLMVLAESPIDPDTLAALAFHAEQSGDRDAVIRHAPAAAERAALLGANREAAELFALALRHADTVSDEQRVIWLEQHAFASYLCGLGEDAVSSWQEAIALRDEVGDRFAQSEDLRRLSHQLWGEGRTIEAAEAGMAALRLVQGTDPSTQLAWSLANIAEQGVLSFDPGATDYATQAITVGTQVGDDAVVLRARGSTALSRLMQTGRWDELEAVWREAMTIDARGDNAGLLGNFACWFAALHYDLDRADRYVTDANAYSRDRNQFTFELLNLSVGAMVSLHRGDWPEARACAEDLLSRPGVINLTWILPRLTLALIHARGGKQPVASFFDDIAAASDIGHLRVAPVWAARAEAAWLAGDDEMARSEVQTGLAMLGTNADPWLVWQLHRWAHLTGGTTVQVPADHPTTPFHLEVNGDWQAATQEWARRGCPYEAAIAQLGGDITAVVSALATFRKLGAAAAARRAQQRLTALRGHTRRTKRADILADPDGLSRREREVLNLVAAGHSDADIATKLSISRRTVGHHVSSILTKLHVGNRNQAAAHARQHPAT